MAGVAAAFHSLSADNTVQYILADVPFFATGILSLGVFTFFVFMKRADSLIFCLHMAVVVAFVSSILDLVQMLIRGSFAVDKDLGLTSVSGLIIAREVGYSLSFGLRFLFFWGFVARPPPGEVLSSSNTKHNGSWGRWGVFGIILEMFTLTLTLVDPVLQILYRNISSLRRIGPVYEVDSAIQILLSVVFILKLLLNCWAKMLSNTDSVPTGRTLVRYVAVIAALVLSAVIGTIDIFMFEFTETVLGRFLQAVELYILVVYMLTATFYDLRRPSWWSKSETSPVDQKSSFRDHARLNSADQPIHITGPVISSPDLLSVVGRDLNSGGRRPSMMGQGSAASRLSSWHYIRRISDIMSGRVIVSAEMDKDPIWSQDKAEMGFSPDDRTSGGGPRDSAIDLVSTRSFNQSITQDPVYTTVIKPSDTSTQPLFSGAVRYLNQPYQKVPDPMQISNLPKLSIPAPTYTRKAPSDPLYTPPSPSVYESPTNETRISGVDDIIRDIASYDDRSLRPSVNADAGRPRSSRISYLMRQQAELDKSIAALRLLSPEPLGAEEGTTPTSSPDQGDTQSGGLTRSQSDFSLSSFPAPPWGRGSTGSEATIPPPVPTLEEGNASAAREQINVENPSGIVPPASSMTVTVTDEYGQYNIESTYPGVDVETALLSSRSRVNSGGTQYEITSFIGGLTRRDETEPSSFSSLSVLSSPDDGQPNPRRLVGRQAPADSSRPSGPIQRSSGTDEVVISPENFERTVSEAGSPPRRAFVTADSRFNRPVGLPPRPRLASKDPLTPVSEAPSS